MHISSTYRDVFRPVNHRKGGVMLTVELAGRRYTVSLTDYRRLAARFPGRVAIVVTR